MEIKVAVGDIAKIKAGVIIINFFEGTKKPEGDTAAVDKALGGAISNLIRQKEIKGKLNEVTLIHSLGKLPADRVVVVGLGKKAELTLDKVRGAVAETCRWLRPKGVESIATIAQGNGIAGITASASAQAIAEGSLLGLYLFRNHITKKGEGEIKQLTVVASRPASLSALEEGCRKGRIMAEATILARDMVNEPSNYMTPTNMAEMAAKLAKTHGLKLTILEFKQMQALKMGALLGVAQGSDEPPKFIVLSYQGKNSKETDITMVGKGVTFDSGGISIKPSEGMGEM